MPHNARVGDRPRASRPSLCELGSERRHFLFQCRHARVTAAALPTPLGAGLGAGASAAAFAGGRSAWGGGPTAALGAATRDRTGGGAPPGGALLLGDHGMGGGKHRMPCTGCG